SLLVAASQTWTALSALPAATRSPLGLNATACTARPGPVHVLSSWPVARFHNRTCLSAHPVRSLAPSGESTAEVTAPAWLKVDLPGGGGICHIFTVPSVEPDRIRVVPTNARLVIGPAWAPMAAV